jgi:hypothetical protein
MICFASDQNHFRERQNYYKKALTDCCLDTSRDRIPLTGDSPIYKDS